MGPLKKNHLLLNCFLRQSQKNISVFQRRTLTPSSPPVRLHTSFAFHSQAVYHERETEKKRSSEYFTRGHLFMLGAQRTTGGEEGVSSFKLLFLEPALLFTQGGSPPRRKLRLHKARVQDPAASRTLWVGGLLLFFSLLLFVICNGLNLS